MRATDFHHVVIGVGLPLERVAQTHHARHQAALHHLDRRDVHGRGKGVVGRLGAIDVVIGVHRLFAAELAARELDGAVGDDLVDVHVRLGARPRLPDREGEVAVQLALGHLGGGVDDGVADLFVEVAELHVGAGRRALHHAEGADLLDLIDQVRADIEAGRWEAARSGYRRVSKAFENADLDDEYRREVYNLVRGLYADIHLHAISESR